MSKKIKIFLINLMIIFSIFLLNNRSYVSARDISEVWEISTSQTITGETIKIDNITEENSAIVISGNSTVVFEDVTLEFGAGVTKITNLIKITTGSTLEFNNVRIICTNQQSVGILNNGILKINKLECNNITKTIVNNSYTNQGETIDSLQLYCVDNPISISLEKNYISLYENTKMSALVTLDMGTTEFADTLMGRVLVKGRNTLARFYQDNFYLQGTPKVSDYANEELYLEYLQENKPYMLDALGDIGDDIELADDGYSGNTTIYMEGDDEDISIPLTNLESGDLIFTKYIVSLQKSGSSNIQYVASKFCTAETFIDITESAYLSRGNRIVNKSISAPDEILNNYTSIIGTKKHLLTYDPEAPIENKCTVSIDVCVGGIKVEELSKSVDIINGSSKAVFVDIDGYTFEEIVSNNASVTILSNTRNARFVRPIIACGDGINSATVTINLESNAPNITNVDILLKTDEFTYNKEDYISQVKPYYVLGEEEIELEADEFIIYNSNDEICTEVIGADTYKIICTSNDQTISFNNSELQLRVNPKVITLDIENEFYYDGNPKSVSATPIGVISDDSINVSFANNSRTIPGETIVNISIDNSNYVLHSDYLETVLKVNKGIMDMSGVTFDDVAFTYAKNTSHTHTASNVPTGVNVRYENNTQSEVKQGEPNYYLTTAYFSIDDYIKDYYEPLTVTQKQAKIIINKAVIDTSELDFDNYTKVYDGNVVELIIADELPAGIKSVNYENNVQSQYSATPYIAVATFVIDESYANNYRIYPESLTATITINKATVDFSNFEFKNMEVAYDGNPHKIMATGYNSELIEVTYLDNAEINAGIYTQRIELVLKDSHNYNPLSQTIYSATLIINKAIVDTSGLIFDDVHHTYDGYNFIHSVTGELPVEIEKVNYMNHVQSQYRAQPYIATATFILKPEYKNNYEANPSTMTAKIYIDQAEVDFSNFKFEDMTVPYDGNSHKIPVTGLDYNKVMVTVLSESYTEVGTYAQEITLTLRDNINYAPIPDGFSHITKTLTIVKAIINLDNVSFADKTYTYSPNTLRQVAITGSVDNLVTRYEYYDSNGNLLSDYPIDSGVYEVQAHFSINGWSENSYEKIPSKKATLTINKQAISFRYVLLESESIVYDGENHSLTVKNMPANVNYEYVNNLHKNVGNYNVSINFTYDTKNYYLTNYTPLNAVLSITPASIDMSGVKFLNKSYTYDKQEKELVITGTLPEFVSVKEYVNNKRINVGTSNAYVSFNVSNSNYMPIDNMYAQLTINAKPITISLKSNTFTYTGNPVSLELEKSGIISGDTLNIQLLNASNINAGTYYATVSSLGNDNYTLQGSTSFRYDIKKASLDMSGVSFVADDVVYDGYMHSPKLVGTLPSGLSYNIVGGNKINVGEYEVICQFSLSNNNYILPSPICVTMTILRRPILVDFSNYSGLVADGNVKNIDVRLIGVVESNFDEYSVTYNKTPINAGFYTCDVKLNDNSNYEIIGKHTITFEILTDTKNYSDIEYDMVVEGGGFSADTNITIVDSNSEDVVETLDNYHVKKYKAFEIYMDSEDGNQEVVVTLAIKSFAVENVKYLKLYKLESGKLKEIEYTRDNGKLKFIANTNDQIILLEEMNQVDKNQVWIYVIVALAIVSFVCILSISIVYIISKKRIK